jgi:hypothetical protein
MSSLADQLTDQLRQLASCRVNATLWLTFHRQLTGRFEIYLTTVLWQRLTSDVRPIISPLANTLRSRLLTLKNELKCGLDVHLLQHISALDRVTLDLRIASRLRHPLAESIREQLMHLAGVRKGLSH